MNIDTNKIQSLIERPGESLSVEIKRWIDPNSPEGQEKIIRTVLALRNHGGGFLLIGFDNETLQPDHEHAPPDVKTQFHIDKIQPLISRFSSEPFEIILEFPEREGQTYPVIVVPSGVKTPVAARSELVVGSKKVICPGDVYVRSLRANNTPSTTRAGWQDWPTLAETCFDNREADIGRFLRRHLGGLTPETLRGLGSTIMTIMQPSETQAELLQKYLKESSDRFAMVTQERKFTLPPHGTWETALIFNGTVPPRGADGDFLSLLASNNPEYTGWPVWLDARGFADKTCRPYIYEAAWEALVVALESSWGEDIDFMRLDPKGRFYLRRAFQDDLSRSDRAPKPGTALDFGLVIIRTAEAIAVGLAFGKAMGCDLETTTLNFAFQWSGLKDRTLTSWTNPSRRVSPRKAYQDKITSLVDVPLDVPLSALNEYVYRATQPVLGLFEGFSLDRKVCEDLTLRLIERRL